MTRFKLSRLKTSVAEQERKLLPLGFATPCLAFLYVACVQGLLFSLCEINVGLKHSFT